MSSEIRPADILIVDDMPANLQLLSDMLKARDCKVRAAPNGALALRAAAKTPPDLILLDINMPEMTGYEVCEHLKKDAKLKDIPVIFISALSEPLDKVKAFGVGGVDYVTKPFQVEEVHARIETHLKIRRLQLAERAVLEDTLNGAIRVMSEILEAAAPETFRRTERVKKCVSHLAARLELEDRWEFELAAMLSQIGAIAVPPETLERVFSGATLKPEEQRMWDAVPETGKRLLLNIPRLEHVAAMIAHQSNPTSSKLSNEREKLGANILSLAHAVVGALERGESESDLLRRLRTSEKYPTQLLDSLVEFVKPSSDVGRKVSVDQLTALMVLDQDVVAKNGLVVMRKGHQLSWPLIERLRNFAKGVGIDEPIHVRVAESAAGSS